MPVLVYAGILFYLSSLSQSKIPDFHLSDLVLHLAAYSGFGYLWVRALRPAERGWGVLLVLAAAVAGTIGYGLSDEIHQLFVVSRSFEWADLAADAGGGLVGGGLLLLENYVKGTGCRNKV